MLNLLDNAGNDLVANPPIVAYAVNSPAAKTVTTLTVQLVQSDVACQTTLAGVLNWNDGSLPEAYYGNGTVAIQSTRLLPAGSYIVNVAGRSYALPPEEISANFFVQVAVRSNVPASAPIIYGPILPKDAGYPNAEQWNFNLGSDLEVLASSLKMLLTTSRGDRIMLPEYGTNLRAILFEFQSPGLASMCQQEVIAAISVWEPRVTLVTLTTVQSGPREITLNLVFASKLSQQQFPLPLTFTN